jgi:hypothetical protein
MEVSKNPFLSHFKKYKQSITFLWQESFNSTFDTEKFNEIMWGVLENVFVNHCYDMEDAENEIDKKIDNLHKYYKNEPTNEGGTGKPSEENSETNNRTFPNVQRPLFKREKVVKHKINIKTAAHQVRTIKRVVRDIW